MNDYKKIFLGADHQGFKYKEAIKKFLDGRELLIVDMGTNSEESTDYPIYAAKVAQAVSENSDSFGVLICGSGIGMAIAANKVKGVRAATIYNSFGAEFARKHNDANIACFGKNVTPLDEVLKLLDTFLNAEFEGERHLRRVNRISELEKSGTPYFDAEK